jgi:hypothetical protein
MESISELMIRQIELNRTKNLLYAHSENILEIDPRFVEILDELMNHDEAFTSEIQELTLPQTVQAMIKSIHAINQFIRITPAQQKELESIYRDTWKEMEETRDVQEILKNVHYPRLRRWLSRIYPDKFVQSLSREPKIGKVVCEEYSPQLQLDLLGLDIKQIKQPVLDVGCGKTGGLVRFLRKQGIDAYGIDHQMDMQAEYLTIIDWFDYAFESGKWGTIVSNMAFSNHLVYAFRNDTALFGSYLEKYKEILQSLQIGGAFYYAPGISFVEEYLSPDMYRMDRLEVHHGLGSTTITRMHR